MVITSVANPKVKSWVKLKEKKYRDKEGLFIIEGDHLLNEALKEGLVQEIISIDASFLIPNIPFYEVSKEIISKLSNQKSLPNVIAIVKKIPERKIKGDICILDNIQDPGNLGTIIRSALAFNIDTIILSNDTVDLYNEKVLRATEGMLFHLNFIKDDLNKKILELKSLGYKIYGTDVNRGDNLKNINFASKKAIIIGNEGKGMKEELQPLCDTLINIPLNSRCESLNAGVAASIIFYQASLNCEF